MSFTQINQSEFFNFLTVTQKKKHIKMIDDTIRT